MCGLGGYCNIKSNAFSLNSTLLHNMHQVLAHRGPDDGGVWTSQIQEVALVHRRLSIIDLSSAGAQPMTDSEETIVVVFNGEIYNYKQLRLNLVLSGYHFRSQTDTEVIIYAYKCWGIDFIHKLDGKFAIALFDRIKNELYLIRDRMGIKPLYFTTQNNILSFASEIKALWQLPWIEKRINSQAVSHYLSYLVTPAPMTMYDQVYKLPAGFYAKLDVQRVLSFQEWYNPLIISSYYVNDIYNDEVSCINQVHILLQNAVKKRMIADVPVGVLLSGGIDSSLTAALMAQETSNLKTFNIAFSDGPEYEERAWAQRVARYIGAQHYEVMIGEKEAFEFFETMVYMQDEPLGDCVCIPLYYVSKLAKQEGVTVVQVGEGADELFCGYAQYKRYLALQPWWQFSQRYIPAVVRQRISYLANKWFVHPNTQDTINAWGQGRTLFRGGAFVFSESWKKQVMYSTEHSMHDPIIEQMYPDLAQVYDSYAIIEYHQNVLQKSGVTKDFFTLMTYLELKNRLPELLLMRVDKMTMANSIEARVPFLDYKLVEYALRLPTRYKYKNGVTKSILKKVAQRILPYDVVYRPKIGFAAPIKRWFKEGSYFKTYFEDLLFTQQTQWNDVFDIKAIRAMYEENKNPAHDYSYQLWALQNILALQRS